MVLLAPLPKLHHDEKAQRLGSAGFSSFLSLRLNIHQEHGTGNLGDSAPSVCLERGALALHLAQREPVAWQVHLPEAGMVCFLWCENMRKEAAPERNKAMKLVAINGSPKMEKGSTALILDPFLEGAREAGAEVSIYYTRKLKINPCQGDFRCSTDTPGICMQKDDMQMLHPQLCEADIWVMATPVYVSGMTGPLKSLIDRILIPLGEPQITLRDGHCHHPLREDVKRGQVVLVALSPSPERGRQTRASGSRIDLRVLGIGQLRSLAGPHAGIRYSCGKKVRGCAAAPAWTGFGAHVGARGAGDRRS